MAQSDEAATTSGKAAGEDTQTTNATDESNEWGKFYSMPPRWTRDDRNDDPSTPSKPNTSPKHLTDENIGHKLASLLRYHLGENNGITCDDEGWVQVENLVENAEALGLGGCTAEDLVRVAETNEHSTRGKRFESDGAGRIKANYKHPSDRRGGGYNRDPRGGRSGGSRWKGYNDWYSNGWNDKDGWQENGGETWSQWKKPGFSPSPDDVIVAASSWTDAAEKPANPATSSQAETVASEKDAACEWEQWFTPEALEAYFFNTRTEEVFFPGDAADLEEKGWCKYLDVEGDKEGKVYWWHEPTGMSFYEEHAVGEA